ncbi:hypothetical protein BCR43DRAFT_143337 [Syncephalastrum racemosum]|uniref:Uncharacterized protein n=1 Tax=Syncephalastrum racemosum TaxID=13706 RepID=A0A1X2HM57_SYNRA|nr:hypothetical protein BCR43DRAFT_143337 [Syncephalastrum racemosum]
MFSFCWKKKKKRVTEITQNQTTKTRFQRPKSICRTAKPSLLFHFSLLFLHLLFAKMKRLLSLGAVVSFLTLTLGQTNGTLEARAASPFHWAPSQQFMSPYVKTGKMEQIGRTGVSAMHAVLLSENEILVIDKVRFRAKRLFGAIQR